jgi:hypothetical protein
VLALTAQVAALQPLAPRVDTLEAEKASLEGALERTDEALQVWLLHRAVACRILGKALLFIAAAGAVNTYGACVSPGV